MDVKRRTVIGAAAFLLMLVAAGCSGGDGAGAALGPAPSGRRRASTSHSPSLRFCPR
jgi:hypothetical protein